MAAATQSGNLVVALTLELVSVTMRSEPSFENFPMTSDLVAFSPSFGFAWASAQDASPSSANQNASAFSNLSVKTVDRQMSRLFITMASLLCGAAVANCVQ